MTSWNVLYYRLRANFDGLISNHYEKIPKNDGEGKAIYDLGKRVTNISYMDGTVTLTFNDISTGGVGSLNADLVIATDGSHSSIRQLLIPNLRRYYAGYFAWRGIVIESAISEESKNLFNERSTLFYMDKSYIIL